MDADNCQKVSKQEVCTHTVQEVFFCVIQHVCVLEAGELALEPPKVALPSSCGDVLCLLANALFLMNGNVLDAL